MGNDVGVAGLFSLLPIASDRRAEWLAGLCEILEDARERQLTLSEGTMTAIWQVAESETAPGVAFSTAAYDLVALIATPQAASLLWERASSVERDDLRVIAFALMRFDPGRRLGDLLNLYANVLSAPYTLFSQRPEPTKIGIPFEMLAEAVKNGKPKIAHAALTLIGRLEDPRVVPFLISQLSRKLPQLREVALRHLRRLKATEAADAVAKLMLKDEALALQAAQTLCEWDDDRCVPTLIAAASKDEETDIEKLIKLIGRFKHPAFDAWLIEGLDELKEGDITEQEDAIVEAIGILIHVKSKSVPILFEKLAGFNSQVIKQALARYLPKVEAEWAQKMHRTLIGDKNANVTYTAALHTQDVELGKQLLASRDEVRRILGVRVLWNAKSTDLLLALVREEKTNPARNMAIVALGFLHTDEAIPVLQKIVETEDRLDIWGQNSAILAWRSLAKMGAFSKKEEPEE
jgi:HEAT repeat protein